MLGFAADTAKKRVVWCTGICRTACCRSIAVCQWKMRAQAAKMEAAQPMPCSGNHKIACQITRGRVDAEQVALHHRPGPLASRPVLAQF